MSTGGTIFLNPENDVAV